MTHRYMVMRKRHIMLDIPHNVVTVDIIFKVLLQQYSYIFWRNTSPIKIQP